MWKKAALPVTNILKKSCHRGTQIWPQRQTIIEKVCSRENWMVLYLSCWSRSVCVSCSTQHRGGILPDAIFLAALAYLLDGLVYRVIRGCYIATRNCDVLHLSFVTIIRQPESVTVENYWIFCELCAYITGDVFTVEMPWDFLRVWDQYIRAYKRPPLFFYGCLTLLLFTFSASKALQTWLPNNIACMVCFAIQNLLDSHPWNPQLGFARVVES